MTDLRFLTLATDPHLVPGIYNGCDQWCHYCPATDRCLAYKCRPDRDGAGSIYENIEAKMLESMRYLKACHEAEGLQPPEDLERLLSGDPPPGAAYVPIDDPLERMGRHYAVLATAFLASLDEPLPVTPLPKREYGPTPFDVFLYYHVQIAVKIYRAISSAREAARTGGAQARWDADVSAKVALLDVDRSDEALQVMALDDPDPLVVHMRTHLSRLRRVLEERFPAARTLIRPGLDTAPADDASDE
jgi:hypothetical protein